MQPGQGAASKLWKELIRAWGGLVGRGLSNKSMAGGGSVCSQSSGADTQRSGSPWERVILVRAGTERQGWAQ